MTASARHHGNQLTLAGRVSSDNALVIRQQGERWLCSLTPDTGAAVDLSGSTATSSVLLSLLLCLYRKAGERRIALAVTGASEELVGLARLNGVSHWLTGPG